MGSFFKDLVDSLIGGPATAAAPPAPYPPRMQWWGEARFGMFIHWGPVSLTGAEISWSRANSNPQCPNNGPIPVEVYDNLYKQFNPTRFDADEWVAIARAAGMKYMVFTAKHCDGFLLWDSKVSDYNIMQSAFKRDVCAELAAAAHAQGLRLGWYFSPMDWRDPDCRSEHNDRFVARMQAELRELLGNYGKIDLLWFDADGKSAPWDQAATYALVKRLQPEIVINNRLDLAPGVDWGSIAPQADFATPEQRVGAFDVARPWESCMTLSAKNQWAWGGPDDRVKSFEACLQMLIDCAGGDGNLLLNVGPMPTGEISPDQVTRLKEIGAWLAKNGESIYGTRGGPFKAGEYGASTRRGSTIYLHLGDWTEGTLALPAIPARVLRSRLPGGGQADVRQSPAAVEVRVADRDRGPIDTVVALELDGAALGLAAADVPTPVPLTATARVSASNVYQDRAEYGPDKAIDGDGETRWATDSGIKSAWLEVDLRRPATFDRAVIRQALPELQRIRKFAIEYEQNGRWIACYRGQDLEARLVVRFNPVSAQRVRLNITEATDGPTVSTFLLFAPTP